ncbi:trigger factor [Bacteroidetes bacterium endosymbiont of Geopemphigus sp.]|uniref:trigger factor n=1 Tax=Bacteroidetes bacterium endosymbiont of Geopemphigus sp. TaxID=2047937 RepID=UPI000CD237C0|nr:trigger factor [Bacteroidetes bacterium endosymbiont of Geopemphigus sp.]
MNINRQQLDQLNAVLTVSLSETDYKDKVEENLRNYRKKAQLPGFRKGQVPLGVIRKQYYRALVNKEIQRLIEQGLNEYITKEGLQILGTPLPKEENFIDLQAKEFSLAFDLGFAPEFDINLDEIAVDYYHIHVKEEEIEEQIQELRRRFGKFLPKEFVNQEDYIHGKIDPLDSRENEGKKYTFTLKDLPKETLAKFFQSKVGDRIQVNTSELFPDDEQWRRFDRGSQLVHFQAYFTIEQIFEIQPADLDQELFDKTLGTTGKVRSLEEFREKIKESLSQSYKAESERFFLHLIFDHLSDRIHFDLPSAFLRRSMKQSQKEVPPENEFLQEYEQAEKALRHQLLESKLAQQLQININPEEVKAFALSLAHAQRGKNAIDKAAADQFAEQILQSQKEALQIYERLFKERLTEALKARLPLKNKNISWPNFLEILQGHQH